MDHSSNKCIAFLEKHKAKLIYLLLFLITTLPFFIFQLVFIFENAKGVIYGERINLLSNTLGVVLSKTLTFKDYFSVNNNQYFPMTLMLVNLEINKVGINNLNFVSYLFPFLLYIVSIIIWLFKLFKTNETKVKDIIFVLIYGFATSLFIYSSYNWQTIWNWHSSIVLLANVLFLISIGMIQKSTTSKKLNYLWIIGSFVITIFTILLFGNDGYIYPFAMMNIALSVYFFISKNKKKENDKWFYLGNASLYLIVIVVYSVLIGSKTIHVAENNFGIILQSFIFRHSATIVSFDSASATPFVKYLAGISVILIAALAVYIYFKKKYYTKNIFIFGLFLFGELAVLYSSIFEKGDSIVNLHYITFAFVIVFAIDVLITLTYEVFDSFMEHSIGIIVTILSSVYAMGMLLPQFHFSLTINESMKSYRDERINLVEVESIMFGERDDEYLENFFNTDPGSVKNLFNLLGEYSLYTYDINQPYFETITYEFKTTDFGYGLYDLGSDSRFTDKEALFFLKSDKEAVFTISLYNPGNFKKNSYTITVNDNRVYDSTDIEPDGLHYKDITLKRGINKIKITLDHYTCPSEEGLSGDLRHLGLLIAMSAK